MNDVEIIGMEDVLKKLKVLPAKVQKNVLTGAIRASAKPIIKEAKRLVPVDSGTLKKSIGIRKRRSRDKNIIHFSVAPLSKKDGWYGRFVEFGTVKMASEPFMRPAFEKEGGNTIKAAKEYMIKRIDKEIAKL